MKFLFASSSFPGSCVLLSRSFRAKPATVGPTSYATNRYTPVDNPYSTASFSSELHLCGKNTFLQQKLTRHVPSLPCYCRQTVSKPCLSAPWAETKMGATQTVTKH